VTSGVQVDPDPIAAVFRPPFPLGSIDQDPPHRLGKEMAAGIPVLYLLDVHQPQIRFMDQRRSLQCLPRLFLSQFGRRQLAQFVIHQRQQLLGSLAVTPLDSTKDSRDIRHG
jgi:hypothetical protein